MSRILVSGGHVLTMDPVVDDLPRGDVLVEDGTITAIAPSLDVDDAEVIDADGMVVMPGLLDTHTHLWQTPIRGLASDCWGQEYFTTIHPFSQRVGAEEMASATFAGALELLAGGVTTVVDFCHSIHTPQHPDASLDAFERSGIRAVFGYSVRDRPELTDRTLRSTAERLRDAARVHAERDGGRLTVAVALNNIEHVSADDGAAEIAFARELGAPMMVHSVRHGQIADLHRRSLLGPDIQWVHATEASDVELDMLADHGGAVAATPAAEALTLGVWPVIGRAVRAGVPVGLGMDLISALGASIPEQVRSAVVLDRLHTAHERRVQGHPPVRDGHRQPLDARDALSLATYEAARSMGMESTVGSLAPGKAADLLLLTVQPWARPAGDMATHVAMYAGRADVHTVLVDGRVKVRDGRLVDVDLAAVAASQDAARARMVGEDALAPLARSRA